MADINWMKVLLDSGATGTTILSQISRAGGLDPIWQSMIGRVEANVAARAAAAPVAQSVPASWVSGEASAGAVDAYATTAVDAYAPTLAAEAGGGGAVATGSAGAVVAGALPVVTMIGVWVALGSGYYEAREAFKSENAKTGFAQGFVMAVLGWNWNQARDRFGRQRISINAVDEAMDLIRVNAYNRGLKTGFLAGLILPDDAKKKFRRAFRKAAGSSAATEGWVDRASQGDQSYAGVMEHARARNVQNSYVIALAAAALSKSLIARG
jgi:hypothetical protein